MKRKITADEVRHFIECCDKQFREAGFFLNSVRFLRNDKTDIPQVILNYEERQTDIDSTDKSQTDCSQG